MRSIIGIVVLWQLLTGALCGSVSRGEFGEVKLFLTPAAYDVETAVALNDVAKKDLEIGYHIRGALHVRPLWIGPDSSEFFLQFNLVKPKLYLRGKGVSADFRPFDSIWDSYRDTEFFVHWKSGVIQSAYLDSSEPVDILNYKKSLISLFQFQIIDGEYKETDVSGTCDVLYESISTDVFRKIKRKCILSGAESSWETAVHVRRATRYTLGEAPLALQEVYADELLQLGDAALGVKARSWHRLRLAAHRPRPAAALPDLASALQTLPANLPLTPLTLTSSSTQDDEMSLEEALEANRGVLQMEEAEAGGKASDARAVLQLLPALRAANASALRALLDSDDAYPDLVGLCRLLGLAGTRAAHAAADGFLHLSARDPLQPLAGAYLAAFALGPAPHALAVANVAQLADAAKDPAVAEAALLAATAAAHTLGDEDVIRTLRDDVARGLARCKDDSCRAPRLLALGHLRRGADAELLLEHAESGGRVAALAALRALAALPADALHIGRRRRLERLALRPGTTLEVRAAALDLWLHRSAERPLPLAETAARLRGGPVELRRLFWQRLADLASLHAPVHDLTQMLPPQLRTWNEHALAGTSMALSRSTGWAAGGWAVRLDSLQAAAAGLLRRGAVALTAQHTHNSTQDLLTVEVWSRGLEALAGGGGGAGGADEAPAEAEDVAGGLAFSVAGISLPPVSLFTGQAELLGHVWAGTGSAPTPALRALSGRGAPARLPLLGGAWAAGSRGAALALALDARAAVSLWSRGARAGLALRAGAAAEAALAVRTAWGRARAQARLELEPRLRVASDLDFYDAVTLCVRVRLDDYVSRRMSRLQSSLGSRPLTVSRGSTSTVARPGRSLSLGRAPDAACRALQDYDD